MRDPNPGATSWYFSNLKKKINCAKPFFLFVNWRQGGGLLPNKLADEKLVVMYKTAAGALAVGNPHKKNLGVVMEVYDATPIFIPVDIPEEVVE